MKKCSNVMLTAILGLCLCSCYQSEPETTAAIFARGSTIHGANGIMFDSEDQLYIASVIGREIVVMNRETGDIINRLGVDAGIEGPDDLTFGPDGSLYWTSIFSGEVGKLSLNGVNTSQTVASGVNAITFSNDGRLFVALDFFGDALYELDPNLNDSPRLIAENLGWLNGMDWGPDGFLYGPIYTQGRVVRIEVDRGDIETVADGFSAPAAVKFDSQGNLHVVDNDNATGFVYRVDTETGSKEVLSQLTPGLDNLAFDSQDRLFVSNHIDGFIVEVLSDGNTRMVSPGGMIAPGGIAVLSFPDGEESVFVADVFSLREFDSLTGDARSVARHLLEYPLPGIIAPLTVSTDGDCLVLSSYFTNAVQVWDPEKQEILEEYTNFDYPSNAIRFQGDLVVIEIGSKIGASRIVRVSEGEQVTLADAGDLLLLPSGLAASNDDLWVSDWLTGMVLQIVKDGELLERPIPVPHWFYHPEGLAVDSDGNLLVVESGSGKLIRVDLTTMNITVVVEGLELGAAAIQGFPPSWVHNGVSVGPSGSIYVTGDVANVVYRIEPQIVK